MRLKLPLPQEEKRFSTTYTLGLQEMNYGNHLGNDKVLTLAHEARLRFFKGLGFDELNFFHSSLIQASAQVQYTGQGYYGDPITIDLWLPQRSETGFEVFTLLKKENSEIARVSVALLFYDYDKGRIQKCPLEFIEFMEAK